MIGKTESVTAYKALEWLKEEKQKNKSLETRLRESEAKLKVAEEALEWISKQMTPEFEEKLKEWEGSGTACFVDAEWQEASMTKLFSAKAKEALEQIQSSSSSNGGGV